MPRELLPDEVDRVTEAIYAGRKIEAIEIYRTATGDGLAEAKQVVEGIESRLRAESPEKFSAVSQSTAARILITIAALTMLVGGATLLFNHPDGAADKPVPQAVEPDPAPAKPLQADALGDQTAAKAGPQRAKAIRKSPKLIDSTVEEAEPFEGVLAGAWLLHLDGRKEHLMHLARADATHFRLGPNAFTFSGLYEVRGGRLVMEKPVNPRAVEFQWSIRDAAHLRLVVQPALGTVGGNYLGGTPTRPDVEQ